MRTSDVAHEFNWAGTYRYGYEKVLRPRSVAQVQRLVADEESLHALGSGHSFNAMADGTVAVALDKLAPHIVISDDRSRVSVSGGTSYGTLATQLQIEGLALHNLASLPHISVAGAIATGSHGSGDTNGNLATAVTALQLVTSSGDLLEIDRSNPIFPGSVVHLGALGIVVTISLAVEPTFDVRQRVYEGLAWESLLANFDAVMGSGYSVSIFTDWGSVAGQVWVKALTDAEDLPQQLFGASTSTQERHPILGLDPGHCTPQLGAPGPWWERLPHFRMGSTPSNGEEIQSEFHVPREHGPAAVRALLAVSDRFTQLVQDGEIRTVRRDSFWMSPQYEQDTVALHFTWLKQEDAVRQALYHVEAALEPFNPRPHWGKVYLEERGPVGRRYERLQDFLTLKHGLDPKGKFSNDWLHRNVLSE